MNETSDPLDDAFAEQLKALVPAAMPTGKRSDDQPGLEAMLCEAGYRAGSADRARVVAASARPGYWISMVAASLMAVVMTMPVAYRVGQRSLGTVPDPQRTVVSSAPNLDAPNLDAPNSDESQDATQPKEAPTTVDPFNFNSIGRFWQSDRQWREQPTDTLTAFHRSSFEDLPESNGIAAHDDAMIPRETMSVGDLGDFTLGLQENQR